MRRLVMAFALAAMAGAPARTARANGAFPDSMQILLPPDRPRDIILGTNFGLVLSSDNGGTWYWVCEPAISSFVSQYAQGPPPSDTLFAMSPAGLYRSTDGGCNWSAAQGGLARAQVEDAFPDATDASHVLAVATAVPDGGIAVSAVFESRDGGVSFGAPIYQARRGYAITGVEIARTSPRPLYLTMYGYEAMAGHPSILRSLDGGATFQDMDAGGVLGMQTLRLAAVDPANPDKLFLRIIGEHDSLAISEDGGVSLRISLSLGDFMSAFLRLNDGTVLVGTRGGEAHVSTDGGASFTPWAGAPHLRALGERGGMLYGVADNTLDHYAIGVSGDGSARFTPLLRYDQIQGPLACPRIQSVCGPLWPAQQALLRGLASPSPSSMPAPPPARRGCAAAGGIPGAAGVGLLLVALFLGVCRRQRG